MNNIFGKLFALSTLSALFRALNLMLEFEHVMMASTGKLLDSVVLHCVVGTAG